jgi:ArsR family transcriptional regulator
LLIVDFAPHELEFLREEQAHQRLGFAAEQVGQWLTQAGLDTVLQRNLAPKPRRSQKGEQLTVSLWLGTRPVEAVQVQGRDDAQSKVEMVA